MFENYTKLYIGILNTKKSGVHLNSGQETYASPYRSKGETDRQGNGRRDNSNYKVDSLLTNNYFTYKLTVRNPKLIDYVLRAKTKYFYKCNES